MPAMPDAPNFMTRKEREKLADSGTEFYIVGCEWESAATSRFDADRWTMEFQFDESEDVSNLSMSLDDSPIRTKQFGAVRDAFLAGAETVGPCRLTTVATSAGQTVFNIVPAEYE